MSLRKNKRLAFLAEVLVEAITYAQIIIYSKSCRLIKSAQVALRHLLDSVGGRSSRWVLVRMADWLVNQLRAVSAS